MQTPAANTLPAQHWLDQSHLVYSAAQVDAAIDRMVQAITSLPAVEDGLILMCVMRGGLYLSGQLLAKLRLPVKLDYLQANRYHGTLGQDMHWAKSPEMQLAGQTVLVVDDILDEGITLAEVVAHCQQAGAQRVVSVVLTEKDNGMQKPIQADIVGLVVPNQYVFGCGMDVYGWWRNLPEIRALTA